MKALFFAALLSLAATSAFAGTSFKCASSHGDQLTFKADPAKAGLYLVSADKALSSIYLGEIEDRGVFLEKEMPTADAISDWDGNSSVRLTMRKGFLAEAAGAKSKAFLTVYYNDIAIDRVSSVLTCEVIE